MNPERRALRGMGFEAICERYGTRIALVFAACFGLEGGRGYLVVDGAGEGACDFR
eukprot:CAMPEP_0173412492 /NCGR_PEP_ID=MMETSP1356-20130122/79625_1 /TAXON_ID=77927 ORGANISM="Hemiselmis virescens, Strain PCC157" /NCGR_SAMPLE_ID=MMETSP1356 /ASSEMBLY_ACC=CAM_ASM_000847 /LENGTH=54 /DNA_ID=CAMNT_0014374401 /DNA_START=145 /DNA_END=309 /DNA_ORIENTATION=+